METSICKWIQDGCTRRPNNETIARVYIYRHAVKLHDIRGDVPSAEADEDQGQAYGGGRRYRGEDANEKRRVYGLVALHAAKQEPFIRHE